MVLSKQKATEGCSLHGSRLISVKIVGFESSPPYIHPHRMRRINIYILMTVQLMIAGGTHIVAKAIVADVEPAVVLLLRSIISVMGMMIIFSLKGGTLGIDREDVGPFVLLGVLGIPLNQYFYLYGMQFTTAANGALLYAATPSFVLVLSHFMLKETITAKKSIGIALAFVGITIVVFERGVDFSSEYTFGNLMVLIAVVAWALFTILGKRMILKYGALHTTAVMMLFGSVSFFPFGAVFALDLPFTDMTIGQWSGILYLSVGTSLIGYLLWYYALSRIETAKVAVFANGQPIFATILSLIFLDYTITGSFVTGGILTLIGVVVTQLG